jgi:hypothetical protein
MKKETPWYVVSMPSMEEEQEPHRRCVWAWICHPLYGGDLGGERRLIPRSRSGATAGSSSGEARPEPFRR